MKVYLNRDLWKICRKIDEKTLPENKLILSFQKIIKDKENNTDFPIIPNIIRTKNLYLIKWCLDNGCKWCENSMNDIIYTKSIDMLKFALDNGYKWCENYMNTIIYTKSLDMLKFALDNGYKWCENSMNYIIRTKSLDMLKFALDNGCKWCENSMNYIIRTESFDIFDILKFALDNGCKWHKNSVHNIIKTNNIDMLKFAINNDCEWFDEKSLLCTNYYNSFDNESISNYESDSDSKSVNDNYFLDEYSEKINIIIDILYNIKNNYYNFIFYIIISNSNLEMLKYIIENNNKIKVDLQKIVVLSIKLNKYEITEWLEKKFNESNDERIWGQSRGENKYYSSFYDIVRRFFCMECIEKDNLCWECDRTYNKGHYSYRGRRYDWDDINTFDRIRERDDEDRRAMD